MAEISYTGGPVAACIAEALADSGESPPTVSLEALAQNYRHTGSDLPRIKRGAGLQTDEEANLWLLRNVAQQMSGIRFDPETNIVTMKRAKVRQLKLNGERIHFPPRALPGAGLFDSNTVIGTIQSERSSNAADLVASMRLHGWLKGSTIVMAESGEVLSGNRRLAAVAQLREEGVEITPNIVTVPVESDIEKLSIWLLNNTGQEFVKKHQQKLAKHMRSKGMTLHQINGVMDMSASTIAEITKAEYDAYIEARNADVRRLLRLGDSTREVAAKLGISRMQVSRISENGKTGHSDDAAEDAAPKEPKEGTGKRKVLDAARANPGGITRSEATKASGKASADRDISRLMAEGFLLTAGEREGERLYFTKDHAPEGAAAAAPNVKKDMVRIERTIEGLRAYIAREHPDHVLISREEYEQLKSLDDHPSPEASDNVIRIPR